MLEQVICEHLQSNEALAAKLAIYDGKPAVFDYREPAADDPGWQDGARYGRIVFSLQIRDDPTRSRCGNLAVDVLSESNTQLYKDMEPIVRNNLDGYFFVSDDKIISLKWIHRSPGRESMAAVCEGVTMYFQVYCYPMKRPFAVNPASLLASWCKSYVESTGQSAYFLAAGETLPSVFKPTAEKPAFYWRLIKLEPCGWMKDRPGADFRTASLQGHVIVPGQSEEEAELVLRLEQAIEKAERIICDDLSMFVSKDDSADLTADSMRQGQLTIKAAYGIAADRTASDKLQNVSIEMK